MAISALAHAGDNIISTSNLYGGTYNQFKVLFPRLGINTKFVSGDNAEDFAKAQKEHEKAFHRPLVCVTPVAVPTPAQVPVGRLTRR